MTDQNAWVHFRLVDWECPNNNRFNIDTRDFHCGYRWDESQHPDSRKISTPEFLHSREELVSLLERFFVDTGGDGEWRMLQLNDSDLRVRNWRLKYLRIYRSEGGFIVCNSDHRAMPKRLLSSEVDKQMLYMH